MIKLTIDDFRYEESKSPKYKGKYCSVGLFLPFEIEINVDKGYEEDGILFQEHSCSYVEYSEISGRKTLITYYSDSIDELIKYINDDLNRLLSDLKRLEKRTSGKDEKKGVKDDR